MAKAQGHKTGWEGGRLPLQASADGGATWSSACFKRWSAAEATVACRQLSLGLLGLPATASTEGFVGSVPPLQPGVGVALLNVQRCGGDEASLEGCTVLPWGKQECVGEEGIAGVTCLHSIEGSQPSGFSGMRILAESTLDAGSPAEPLRPIGAPSDFWSYVCGDPWAGWDTAAASAACRAAGFPAGGEPLRSWRAGALPPVLLGRLECGPNSKGLDACAVNAAPIKALDTWTFAAPPAASAGVCLMLAGVRCRTAGGAGQGPVTLRKAPAPVATVNGSTVIARLEASIAGGAYGAVCADDGFDAAGAAVACRSLGYAAGGQPYDAAPAAAAAASPADAAGSYLGTLRALTCGGWEVSADECSSYRSRSLGSAAPCRAPAWVACNSTAAAVVTPASLRRAVA
ncbi:Neurotrypsin [Tetrabaena socialis]|uniref:Neurotrypsin n=1 Tax=Tetrabaena socialis TaxID=47790 RepID=A0A2J7ZUA9_9CHLO|nr:Neurotrypsin [Tetrabaena socialis]|eukprot:PNH03820.1 Neurotrypsin [Tetrabaena socialis]